MTVFFVRHGEASHNIKEKEAKERAKSEAIKQGLSADSKECKERMEEARKAVLDDPKLFDCPLSDAGYSQALEARTVVEKLVGDRKLPVPETVLVSPLQRALKTAALVFPHTPAVHVREALRERGTGYACDKHESSIRYSQRETFRRFSFNQMRRGSEAKRMQRAQLPLSKMAVTQVEDKSALRERTHMLAALLLEQPHACVAVVGHKGYLRELERGPLGRADADEFGNCEVRVYEVTLRVGPSANAISFERATRIDRDEPTSPRDVGTTLPVDGTPTPTKDDTSLVGHERGKAVKVDTNGGKAASNTGAVCLWMMPD